MRRLALLLLASLVPVAAAAPLPSELGSHCVGYDTVLGDGNGLVGEHCSSEQADGNPVRCTARDGEAYWQSVRVQGDSRWADGWYRSDEHLRYDVHVRVDCDGGSGPVLGSWSNATIMPTNALP